MQETVSLSPAEAKYRSTRKVVGALIWLSILFKELTIPKDGPFSIYCNSQSTLQTARNLSFMREPNILRSIAILYGTNFKKVLFPYITVELAINWLTFSLRHSQHFVL